MMLRIIFIIGIAFTMAAFSFFNSDRAMMRAVFVNPSNLNTTYGSVLTSTVRPAGSGETWSDIRYQYSVNGSTYVSRKVNFERGTSKDPAIPQAYVAKYPVGAQVVVYYLPNDPNFAVLEPAKTGYMYKHFWFVVGCGVLGTGFLTLGGFLVYKSSKQS